MTQQICCPRCGWVAPFTAPTPIESTSKPVHRALDKYLDKTVRRTLRCEHAGCELIWPADLVYDEVEITIRRTRCAGLEAPERDNSRPSTVDPYGATDLGLAARKQCSHGG